MKIRSCLGCDDAFCLMGYLQQLLAAAMLLLCVQSFAAADAPNVLFIISDDLNCSIGCYGDPVAKTPHIDRLAGRGIRFDRAYCNVPLCNPSRSSVLSGRFPTTTGVLDNKTWLVLDDEHPTLPRIFERHHYAVAQFGKVWHIPENNGEIDPANPPPGKPDYPWFTPAQRTRQQATQPDYWTQPQHYDHYRFDPPPAFHVEQLAKGMNLFGSVPKGKQTPDIGYADSGIAQMEKFSKQAKPFFITVGFRKPHVALHAPQEYFDMYTAEELPLPPDFANEPSGPPGISPDNYRQNLDLYAGRRFSAVEARAARRAYYACVSYIDAQIGRLLDALDRLGEAENNGHRPVGGSWLAPE